MNFLKTLFQKEKEPTLQEMKVALRRVEMERHKKRREIDLLDRKLSDTFEKLRVARRNGEQLQVEWLLNEYKNLQMDKKIAYREARKANLEGITLKNYIRLLEFASKSKKSTHDLIQRIKRSKLIEMIEEAKVSEEGYLQMLEEEMNQISAELGIDVEIGISNLTPEDEELLKQIDRINELEEKGEYDVLETERAKLLNKDLNDENDL